MKILQSINAEPVRWAAVISIALNLAVSYGLRVSTDQVVLLNALVVAILSIIVRGKVAPV